MAFSDINRKMDINCDIFIPSATVQVDSEPLESISNQIPTPEESTQAITKYK